MSPQYRWKMIFGFALLGLVATIAITIALGKVEQNTSYGLLPTLTMLSVLVGNFANWAFGNNHADKTDEGRKDNPDGPGVQ